ncbi:MAG TPA: helix-turn-helix domain-containing protein [Verrucomicrobiae bacterium]|nr:helix-turn-helix domain-containing protein [Verrucomicrobiae bacterium]
MSPTPALQPTLWRTCRVLANRRRLKILGVLLRQSPQTVSSLSRQLKLPLPVASQSLRALEGRGLLTSRRIGRRVDYRPSVANSNVTRGVVRSVRLAFHRDPAPVETLFKRSTAFTHPRRIEIFRALDAQASTLPQIQAATRISVRALVRHLRKLEARGFVNCRNGIYTVVNPPDAFGRALAQLAVA